MEPPDESDVVTFEERTEPERLSGVEQRVRDMETPEDGEWRRFYHSLEVEAEPEEDIDVENETKGVSRGFPVAHEAERYDDPQQQGNTEMFVCAAPIVPEPQQGKYFVNSYDGIEEEARDEKGNERTSRRLQGRLDC